MSKTRVKQSRIERSVGYFVIDYYDDGSYLCYIEEDYGSNTYGDTGLFYKNDLAARPNCAVICYVSEVPRGVIYYADYEADTCMYTYDRILEICRGNEALAELAYELAVGQSIEVIYDDIKDSCDDEDPKIIGVVED